MTTYNDERLKTWVSVDCVVFSFAKDELKLLIGNSRKSSEKIERSLYGGFVLVDESLEEAAKRAMGELALHENIYLRQVGAYGDTKLETGMSVLSVAYCALIDVKDFKENLLEKYGLEWVSISDIKKLNSAHRQMVNDALALLRSHINTEPLAFSLLPELFTLTQLQRVYEAVLDEEIDKRNFRKRIKQIEIIEKTNLIDKHTSKRGAALYRFNRKAYEKNPSFKL